MKTMKKLALMSLALLWLPMTAQAQEKVEATVQADLLSKYMWRGLDKGGISLQPQAKVSWKGLSLKATGNVGFNKEDEEEFNLELGYTLKGFNIGVIDYWQTGIDYENRYLYYDNNDGAHRLEANIGYSCKYFSLQAYTTFWGIDFAPSIGRAIGMQNTGTDRKYSTYIEAAIPFRLGGLDWTLKGGMTPFESAGTVVAKVIPANKSSDLTEHSVDVNEYLYADGTACVMAALRATKELNLGEVKMPIFAEIHMNPYLQKANFMMGISIIPF